ncbi:reverse transcriptase [Phytophthora palmivora]|uniref:Reverse transcriptase n=1 Tax=Phytophthora palmivora TaxID=4796 RepID=A0A2P4XBE3_9STRA|nr:reverse transcriptase [Phytophthora palmivora]
MAEQSLPRIVTNIQRLHRGLVRESSTVMDAVSLLVNSPTGDMFANGEPDESSLVPVFDRRSFVDDICFGNETFNGCLATLDQLLQRFTECRISVSFTKSIFVQYKVDFLFHEDSSEGIRADPKRIKAVTEVPFPTSKKGMQSFLGALNYYSRFIQDFAVYGAALYQLKDADFTPRGDLTVAKRSFAVLQQKVMDAPILRHFDRDKAVHVMLFANEWALSSTLMQEHDGKSHPVRFCGRVLKDAEMNYHPAEKKILALLLLLKVCYTQLAGRTIHVLTAVSAYLEATTVYLAEYAGMNNGVQTALEHTTEDLVVVGDSRLAIQQSLEVIACHKESLLTQLNRHREITAKFRSVEYLHVVREFNTAADSLANETLESKMSKVVSTEIRLSELTALNRIQDVIYEPTAKAETEDKPSVNTVRAHVITVAEFISILYETTWRPDD